MPYSFIDKQHELDRLLPFLMQKNSWGVDTETTGLDPYDSDVVMLQIGRPEYQYVIDTRKVNTLPLKPFFDDETKKKICHNAKFDYKHIKRSLGMEMEGIRCTWIAEKILNAGRKMRGFGLPACLKSRLNIEMSKDVRSTFGDNFKGGDFSSEQISYGATDVSYLVPLNRHQCQEISKDGLNHTYLLECAALPCFGDMELNGAKLDVDRWQRNIEHNKEEAERIKEELDRYASMYFPSNLFGKIELNYNSPVQALDFLTRLGIRIDEEPLPDTSMGTLESIVMDYPVVKLLQDYRSYSMLINTFGRSYIDAIHKKTGRIQWMFNQLGTETGRITKHSDTPVNPLNIPREKEFRNCFIAEEDFVIETDDYSGCELRILAHNSQDPKLMEAFNLGIDVHCYVASKLFRVEVTKNNENKKLRTPAKSLNFGIAYGMGPMKLFRKLNAENYPITFPECKKLYKAYTEEFQVAVDYLRSMGRLAAKQGYLQNLNGRRRYWLLPDHNDRTKFPNGLEDSVYTGRLASIEREGGNCMIQSVNADITKKGMVLIRDYRKKRGVRTNFVNQVYDEIVTETHKNDTEEFHAAKLRLMKEAAETWITSVPIEVDGNVLPYWTK